MKKIKYAIADDHKIFRQGLITSLSEYEDLQLVAEAENGEVLLKKIPQSFPDVVLMDLKMPVMDGIAATGYLRQHHPTIRVIVLSMYDDEKFVVHLMENGAAGYLLKNAEPEEIHLAIEAAHLNQYYFTDMVNKALLKKLVSRQAMKPTFNNEIELTDREIEVLKLICQEYTAPEISKIVCLSPRTIEGIRAKLIEKIGVKNTAGLVMYAMRNHLTE